MPADNLSIIVAVARNGVIGDRNQLLWHISEDLRRFKAITSGHTVVMGRKTFESLGRPLPNRRNIVVSRQTDLAIPGCEVARSLGEAVAIARNEDEVFIIGGGQIYEQALPLASRIYLTVVDADYEGDTHFPVIDPAVWRETLREEHLRGEKFESPFSFINLERA